MSPRKLRVTLSALAQGEFERILAYTYKEYGSSEEKRMSDQLSNTIDTISRNPILANGDQIYDLV